MSQNGSNGNCLKHREYLIQLNVELLYILLYFFIHLTSNNVHISCITFPESSYPRLQHSKAYYYCLLYHSWDNFVTFIDTVYMIPYLKNVSVIIMMNNAIKLLDF